MAATQAVRFSATAVDELGTEGAILSYLMADPGQTITQVFTAYDTWVADVDAIIDGQITLGRVDLLAALPGGLKGSPTAGGRIEQTGNIGFSVHGTSHRYNQVLASFASSKLSAGKINLADTDVAAFITVLTSAALSGWYANQTSQQLNALLDAFLSFRKRRRQLDRSSFER
jgi:hypothetical protein